MWKGKLKQTDFNEEYYHEHQRAGLDYLAYSSWHLDHARQILSSFNLKAVETRLLDLGCACGSIARGFADLGCAVSGVDVNEYMISRGRAKYIGLDLRTAHSIEMRMFKDNEFDFIYCGQVAEHWRKDLVVKILQEQCRVLKPGGILFLALDTVDSYRRQGRKLEDEDPTHTCLEELSWWQNRSIMCGLDYYPTPNLGWLKRLDWDTVCYRKPFVPTVIRHMI